MRRPRVQLAQLGCGVAALLLAAGCGADGEAEANTVAKLAPSSVDVSTTDVASADGAGTLDQSALRSGSENGSASLSGAATTPTGLPSPPTLSDAGQQALPAPGPAPDQEPAPAQPSPTQAVPTTTPAPAGPTSVAPDEEPATTTTTAPPIVVEPSTSVVAITPEDLALGEVRSAQLLNQLRASLELGELFNDPTMDEFARDWSRQMAESGNFEHSSGPYGENIAFTSNTALTMDEAADMFHQLWIESPDHYQNMTDASFSTIGVGLFLTEQGWYGTHIFKP